MRVTDEDALGRFKREIQLARTVTHTNVCRIFDLHRHHEPKTERVITFLTMELVEGETLAVSLVRRGAFKPREALPIVRQIAAALAAAHEKNVVHRDLKAANVILTESGAKAVVTDFGLAYPLAQVTESTVTIVGTPAYMAPEQLQGKPVTAAVDIYAFGVLLYEMVVGRRPFLGDSPIALAIEKIGKHPPQASDAVPSLPPAWNRVISRCLDPRPEHRYASVNEALSQLEGSVEKAPLIRLKRSQKRVLAGVALLVCALVLVGWRYTQSTYTPAREALRLYKVGIHAQQIRLPWKASQFFEHALEVDPQFVGARAHLAEAWMELDQPVRAKAVLQRAAELRPRWQRIARHEVLLEQAAGAELHGDLAGSVRLHVSATTAAPESEKAEVRFSEAASKARAGDAGGALAIYRSMGKADPSNCAVLFAHAVLLVPPQRASGFAEAGNCFRSAGDLEGNSQQGFAYFVGQSSDGQGAVSELLNSAAIAKSNGYIEQQIMLEGFLSEMLLEAGDGEDSYNHFAQAMQVAERHGLRFLSAQLLSDRASYFFGKEDFLQFTHFSGLTRVISNTENMPRTSARLFIGQANLYIRMHLPALALGQLTAASEQLLPFPNAALSAEIAKLTEEAKRTQGRPEGGS